MGILNSLWNAFKDYAGSLEGESIKYQKTLERRPTEELERTASSSSNSLGKRHAAATILKERKERGE